jgi:hypothetical protein
MSDALAPVILGEGRLWTSARFLALASLFGFRVWALSTCVLGDLCSFLFLVMLCKLSLLLNEIRAMHTCKFDSTQVLLRSRISITIHEGDKGARKMNRLLGTNRCLVYLRVLHLISSSAKIVHLSASWLKWVSNQQTCICKLYQQ